MTPRTAGRFLLLMGLLAFAGCTEPAAPPPSHVFTLTRATFADLPGWQDAAPAAALTAFRHSCAILMAKPDATPLGGAGYAGTVGDWRGVCGDAENADAAFFARRFTPFAVRGSDGLFTGYYEPLIHASHARHGAYTAPVYGLPPDLVRVDLGQFSDKWKGEHVSGRIAGHALVPYADRAAIAANGIANAPVLFYADPLDLFFVQIQGSSRVILDDGRQTRIAYAGENGQPYSAIGRVLIAEGALTRENVSLQTIRAWLVANPDRARAVMETNRSYVFFREAPPGDGPGGTQGTGLTPLGSMAVDLRLHALGPPFYVAADGPDPVHAPLVAQDTGGAIRGPVRGDIFFGSGAQAEARAGAMKAKGALFVLLPNELAAKLGTGASYPDPS